MAGLKVRRGIEIGHLMVRKALRKRAKAHRARQRALKRFAAQAAASATRGGPRSASSRAIARELPRSAGVLIAEGDSWFDYPFTDVLNELEDNYGYDVQSVAHHGDTIEDMAYSSGQLEAFARRIEKVISAGTKPKAILLSGGGNDIAGDEFAVLLNHASSPSAGLNKHVISGVIDERIHDAYVTILSSVTQLCRELLGAPVPILIHGYDYAVPDGRGVLGGYGPLPGPWLDPGFRRKAHADLANNAKVVAQLIDRLNVMQQRVTRYAPFAHVTHVDLRNTLSSELKAKRYQKDWSNELHPTHRGFAAIAARFAAALP